MLYGYDSFITDFKRLADSGDLSHAYLFFGEDGVGKFTHALGLANYLENGVFDLPENELRETMVVEFLQKEGESEGNAESIGIDKIREVERFLYKTPVFSKYRIVILRDAQWLTGEAQSALLKTLEEPPQNSLIIATAADLGAFYPTIVSRFFRVYFPILDSDSILDFIHKYGKIGVEDKKLAESYSFGKIGRIISFLNDEKLRKEPKKIAKAILENKGDFGGIDIILEDLLKKIAKNPILLDLIFEELEVELLKDKVKNFKKLGKISQTIFWVNLLNTNKRIQLKSLLYSLVK